MCLSSVQLVTKLGQTLRYKMVGMLGDQPTVAPLSAAARRRAANQDIHPVVQLLPLWRRYVLNLQLFVIMNREVQNWFSSKTSEMALQIQPKRTQFYSSEMKLQQHTEFP